MATLVVALGATVQRTLGFGAALVSVPLLVLINPRFVPGPFTIAGLAGLALMVWGTHRETDWRGVRWMVLGILPGTVVAGVALATLPQDALSLAAGVLILGAVAAIVARRHPRVGRRSLLGAGALSGFMGTTAGVAGPPIALLYHREEGAVIRATLARMFLVSAALTLIALGGAHRLGTADWAAGVAMMPGGPIGVVAGRRVATRVNAGHLRIGVLVVSTLSALAVVARVVL